MQSVGRLWLWAIAVSALVRMLAAAEPGMRLGGVVVDSTGASVPGARILLKTPAGAVLSTGVTDASGHFEWHGLPARSYEISVSASAFGTRAIAVQPQAGESLRVVLEPSVLVTRIAVSPIRGAAEDVALTPWITISKDADEAFKRPMPTIGHLFEHEPGMLVQQSTSAQVSPFFRGLTGYHVVNLVDGVRFNNTTFRSGPNQYLAWVEPHQAERVEAMLGPAGAQYGSDSLGGAIQIMTADPAFTSGVEVHGTVQVSGATADLSNTGAAELSVGTARTWWLGGVAGRRHGDLRAGRGDDSRNVFRRLFGLSSEQVQEIQGNRLQDSGFRQYGLHTKFARRISADQLVSIWYQRGVQDGVRGYKDLLGGLGRLQSAFYPQTLDFFYARWEKIGLSVLDSLSGTFSVNSQQDGSVRQNLGWTDPVTTDYSRVNAFGYAAQATTHASDRVFAAFGADIYDERISSMRDIRQANATTAPARPLYPDSSKYQTFGAFAQTNIELLPRRFRAGVGLRLTGIRFHTPEDVQFHVPTSEQWFRDLTWNSNLAWQVTKTFGVHALIGRGFRAPNLNDLGAIGLNDLGYEIPASDAISSDARLSTDAGESALPKGIGTSVRALRAESMMSYEFGVRFQAGRTYARVQVFDAEMKDPIVRRTLLFDAAAPPSGIAGLPVTVLPQTVGQRQAGVVTVATANDHRAVKAFVNDGRARYYGVESMLHVAVSSRVSLEANYSILNGRELNPDRPARRLPPQAGALKLRYVPSGRRVWVEAAIAAAGAQTRLSGGDIDDERIGASRRRADIADFFQSARVQPMLTDGVFTPTGETLRQIQDRVLPLGATINGVVVANDSTRVPLYRSTAGWASLHLRSGIPIGERWQLTLALENLLDRNYRLHGSGVDAPGISGYAGIHWTF